MYLAFSVGVGGGYRYVAGLVLLRHREPLPHPLIHLRPVLPLLLVVAQRRHFPSGVRHCSPRGQGPVRCPPGVGARTTFSLTLSLKTFENLGKNRQIFQFFLGFQFSAST